MSWILPDVNLPLHPLLKKHLDLVAQSVEHLTFNQGVMGSSPIEITFIINDLQRFSFAGRFLFAFNLHTFLVFECENHWHLEYFKCFSTSLFKGIRWSQMKKSNLPLLAFSLLFVALPLSTQKEYLTVGSLVSGYN